MELIVDANILFAALIKKNITSDLIVENGLDLYSCDFIFSEFRKYKDLIKSKTERTEQEFEKFMSIIEKRIKLFPNEEIEGFIDEAEKTSPDPKDTQYFALALKLNVPIWSNDKKLNNQEKVKIYSTEEIIRLLKK